MPARRFPPPWSVEEQDACFVVIDHSGQKLAYIYFETDTKMMRRPLIAKPPATMKPTALPGPIIRAVYLGIGPSSWRTNSEGVSPKSWKGKGAGALGSRARENSLATSATAGRLTFLQVTPLPASSLRGAGFFFSRAFQILLERARSRRLLFYFKALFRSTSRSVSSSRCRRAAKNRSASLRDKSAT
jgi:hypothetical protein